MHSILNNYIVISIVLAFFAWDQASAQQAAKSSGRWNILFVFADDYGRHAGKYAEIDERPTLNDVVLTPNIDGLADEGAIFRNAFVSAPSCTPSRSALMSGRHFFNTGRGAILRPAVWDETIPSYPLLLADAGYHIGKSLKVWSPGTPVDAPFGGDRFEYESAGRDANHFSTVVSAHIEDGASLEEAKTAVLNEVRANFAAFLDENDEGKPWHYFFGPINTHRPWKKGSGAALWGIDPDALEGKLPAFLPNAPIVREDIADYLGEVQALDAYVGVLIDELKNRGAYQNTLIVISGDHGMPGIPSGKATLYDAGTAVALIVRVPNGTAGRVVDDFVSLADLAPTFLEVAGVKAPGNIYGRSLIPALQSERSGVVADYRAWILMGRERHMDRAREGYLPYPQRAIRTKNHLYIRNLAPGRWPMGIPGGDDNLPEFADMDGGPTKAWLITNKGNSIGRPFYERAFSKRPAEELYDLGEDPDQINNVAEEEAYAAIREELSALLIAELRSAGDPRFIGDGELFDRPPFTDVSARPNRFNEMSAGGSDSEKKKK